MLQVCRNANVPARFAVPKRDGGENTTALQRRDLSGPLGQQGPRDYLASVHWVPGSREGRTRDADWP